MAKLLVKVLAVNNKENDAVVCHDVQRIQWAGLSVRHCQQLRSQSPLNDKSHPQSK